MRVADLIDAADRLGFVVELSRCDELDPEQLEESFPELVDLEPDELVLWVLDREAPGMVIKYWLWEPSDDLATEDAA